MLKKVKKYIEEQALLSRGDGVLVALSGGADSVCLLAVLKELAPCCGWELKAFHLHHGLRGQEADRDAAFVKELCEKWQVPVQIVYRNVKQYAEANGYSTEEAGRILRYEALEQEADAWSVACGGKKVYIAVAHHQDDNAETILHHLMRGSGLRGLSGIKSRQGRRIRPLLCVRREEICRYLEGIGQPWCEDSTNADTDYTRNRIRNQMIPFMTEEINVHAVENILHAGELFLQADAYLSEQAAKVLGNKYFSEGKAFVELERFLEARPIIRSYVIRQMLDVAAPGQKDITAKHFKQLEQIALAGPGAVCNLPGALQGGRDYTRLWIGKQRQEITLEKPEEVEKEFQFDVIPAEIALEIPKNQYTKWFDYDKIKDTLLIRTRQPGDYIMLPGGNHKTIKRYMIDEKIPKQARDEVLLVAEGSHVLWIVGYRISEYYKVTAETRRILQIKRDEGEKNGRVNSCFINRRRSK